ncbi:hypothetical protein V6N13_048524 [Hibiscus sabdariffa]
MSSAASDSAAGTRSAATRIRSVPAPKALVSAVPPSSPVPISQAPPAPISATSAPPATTSADHDHDRYDPMVHTDNSDILEESLDVPDD